MKTNLANPLNVAVLGAGESGIAASHLLLSGGASVTVFDTAPANALGARVHAITEKGGRFKAGVSPSSPVADLHTYGLAVISPGIDPRLPMVKGFLDAHVPVISELELAFQQCAVPVVGITGTNGKTTTTQLVEMMFNGASVPTVACGNIGPAFSSKIQNSGACAVMTVEVSSFQLEFIQTFRPQISVWLNFTTDHLDRYESMGEYFRAKARIFENQGEQDWAVVNALEELPPLRARKLTFSAYSSNADFTLNAGQILFRGERILELAQTRLRGSHNAENLMAALAVGHAWGLSWDAMRAPLCEYRPLPHRCEQVAVIGAIEYINDSKATNLDALEKALRSESKSVVLIAGGKDKGFPFDTIASLVSQKCRSVVLIGEMAERIQSSWSPVVTCHVREGLREAVECAHSLAEPGDVVLFSPGTSSFDMFKNYADRGEQFREIVLEIAQRKQVAVSV